MKQIMATTFILVHLMACHEAPPQSDSRLYLLTGDPLAPTGYYEIVEDGSEADRMIPADLEEIFLEQRTVNPRQEVLSTVRRGELTPEVHERAANPAKYLDEPYLYHSQLMTDADADGNEVTTYRILRQRNPSPAVKLLTPPGPPRVDPRLWTHLETLGPEEDVILMVKLSGLPDAVIPLPLPPERFDNVEVSTHAQRILEAKINYLNIVGQKISQLQPELQSWGALILETFDALPWVRISLPVESLDLLLSHSGFMAVEPDAIDAKDLGCFDPTVVPLNAPPPAIPFWLMGEGRRADRMDIDRFHSAGHTGHIANATRHGYSRLLAGVVESSWMDDEIPGFSGRFIFKKDCSVSPCVYPPNNNYPDDDGYIYPENDENGIYYWREKFDTADDNGTSGSHGSMVSSIFVGNYLNNEASGLPMGDHTWNGSGYHCDPWENASTGMAPGAYLWYVNASPGGNNNPSSAAAYVRAYNTLNNYNIDVLNCSHALTRWDCDIASSFSTEDTLENLYDNGVLVIAAAGNNLLDKPNTECSLDSPSDTPKVLAISGLNANGLSCRQYYYNCLLDAEHTATGGIDLQINGNTLTRAYSGVAISAPQGLFHTSFSRDMTITPNLTTDTGHLFYYGTNGNPWPVGWVNGYTSGSRTTGTSASAPHVAGAGIVLKALVVLTQN